MPCRSLATLLFVLLLSPASSAQTFTDAKLDFNGRAPGTTVADIDGDGRMDILSRWAYLQTDDGFVEIPLQQRSAILSAIVADAFGDGRPEIGVLGATEANVQRYNMATGQFDDVTPAGIGPFTSHLSQGSVWLDYDLDGRLDFFVGNDHGADYLFRNLGSGDFEDVSDTTLPRLDRGTYGAAAADFDRDGDQDIYIGLCIGVTENMLFRNDGGAFAEVGAEAGVDDPLPSWGVVWFDYDNDGWLDLYSVNMPLGDSPGTNALFRNLGDGTFEEVGAATGTAGDPEDFGLSAAAADFDNDGWLDLFVANQGSVKGADARLLRNRGDGTFEDLTEAAGLGQLATRGVSASDINGDGWVDLTLLSLSRPLLFNDGGSNGWLIVRLRGTESNPDGVGARVEVSAGDLQMVREVSAGSGMMSQSHGLTAHFGLGAAASADVTVRWPSGQVQTLTGLVPSQRVTVVEGVGRDEPPAMFGLQAPSEGAGFPPGSAVTLEWEPAADAEGPVTYTVYLAGPDGDQEFETEQTSLVAAALTEGAYGWSVSATDEHSYRAALDRRTFTVGTVAAEPTATAAPLALTVWPNPASVAATARLELARPGEVAVALYDVLGRVVWRSSEWRGAGAQAVSLPDGLAPGRYLVRVTASGQTATAPLVRVR